MFCQCCRSKMDEVITKSKNSVGVKYFKCSGCLFVATLIFERFETNRQLTNWEEMKVGDFDEEN